MTDSNLEDALILAWVGLGSLILGYCLWLGLGTLGFAGLLLGYGVGLMVYLAPLTEREQSDR